MMHTGVVTLTEFLLARIAEEKAAAEDLICDRPPGAGPWLEARGAFGPDRVLAECKAKRQIVEEHPRCDVHDSPGDECDACQRCGHGSLWPCDTLLALASVYADHPDYREEWRP